MRKPHQAGYPMAVDDMAKLAAELSKSGYREINNPDEDDPPHCSRSKTRRRRPCDGSRKK